MLSDKKENALVSFLRNNRDVFAWKPMDLPGIPREIAEHAMNIQSSARLVTQWLHYFDEEKHKAIGEEVAKLLAVVFIREIHHPMWVANPVQVKKYESWRMCVDYTNLNKACPKDPFPSHKSTRSWTPPRGASRFLSWTPTRAPTISL